MAFILKAFLFFLDDFRGMSRAATSGFLRILPNWHMFPFPHFRNALWRFVVKADEGRPENFIDWHKCMVQENTLSGEAKSCC